MAPPPSSPFHGTTGIKLHVLGSHTVPCFVKEGRDKLVRTCVEEGVQKHDFRHRVVRTACVTTVTGGRTTRGEENDSITAQLHVRIQVCNLLCGECFLLIHKGEKRYKKEKFVLCCYIH